MESEKLNGLRISTAEALDDLDIPVLDSKDKAAAIRAAIDYCQQMDGYDCVFDRSMGLTAWLRGNVLNQLKPVTPREKGICEHGDWQIVVTQLGYSDSSLELYRHCASTFSRHEAQQMGYKGMRDQLRPSQEGQVAKQTRRSKPKDPETTPRDIRAFGSRLRSACDGIEHCVSFDVTKHRTIFNDVTKATEVLTNRLIDVTKAISDLRVLKQQMTASLRELKRLKARSEQRTKESLAA